jgi:hypothetical protein
MILDRSLGHFIKAAKGDRPCASAAVCVNKVRFAAWYKGCMSSTRIATIKFASAAIEMWTDRVS